MYTVADKWLRLIKAKKTSSAVVLCGHEAAEVKIIKQYLGWNGRIVAADFDSTGLEMAVAQGGVSYHGDVYNAIEQEKSIGFIHLDWTGTLGKEELDRMYLAINRMPLGGVLAVTLLAARDSGNWLSSEIQAANEEGGPKRVQEDIIRLDPRLKAMVCLMRRLPGGPHSWSSLFQGRYNSGKSPMQTIMFAKVSRLFLMSHGLTYYSMTDRFCISCCDVRFKTHMHLAKLRYRVLKRIKEGANADSVAVLYNLKRTTIAAWRAHETMGTYSVAV
jgi:hypothetical protein